VFASFFYGGQCGGQSVGEGPTEEEEKVRDTENS
jgi:hypothetical protein